MRALVYCGGAVLFAATLAAQQPPAPRPAAPPAGGLTVAQIEKPSTDSWPTYNGDYSGRRFSTLTKINAGNVKNLSLAWIYDLPAAGTIKATPLQIGGVLYFTTPNHVYAIDARTARELWHYTFSRSRGGIQIGNRGVAVLGSTVYFVTTDCNLVALDIKTGTEKWAKEFCSLEMMYYGSVAPVVVKDKLILGPSGDDLDVPAYLEARSPENGDLIWRWFVTPQKEGDPGLDTWPNLDMAKHGGGMTWQPVTYDPELNHIYVTTGNPQPVVAFKNREGANLYTASIVALNADTGKMVWYYQTSPNDAWDFDSTQTPVLIDTTIDGQPRKLVAQATRNGMFFLLDRTNGRHLLSSKVAESVNWSTGFNSQGQPVRNPDKLAQSGGALISPNNGGVQNWAPPTYMPETGLLYLNAAQGFDIHYTYAIQGAPGELGHQAQAVGGYDMSLRAIDIKTGKAKWIHRYAGSEWNPPRPHQVGGLLSTAGNLVFSGAPGGFMVAYDPQSGRQLWHTTIPAAATEIKTNVSNTPITYMMDGRQYLVFAADDALYSYALPR